ncbi:MAG: hypothetical protein F4X64_00205 [Chloroflexi bacterium]|nr:hypothetical protein [Chloroflexota bacterium]
MTARNLLLGLAALLLIGGLAAGHGISHDDPDHSDLTARIAADLGFDDLREDVEENTAALATIDAVAAQASDARDQFAAAGDEPIAEPCEAALAALDRLRYVGGEPVLAEADKRQDALSDLATALISCGQAG